jgi:hypothetical protein
MMQVSSKFRRWKHEGRAGLHYWCQGCEKIHGVVVEGSAAWSFNGDYERPTFTPSVLVRSGHYARGGAPGNCWCDFEARTGTKSNFTCTACHTFITDGQVQFLNDCSHVLAGQTLPLPDLPPEYQDDEEPT